MTTYDQYLDQQIEQYNSECDHYKDDNGVEEYCKHCDYYCSSYLKDVDLEELTDEVVHYAGYIEDYPESSFATKYLKKLNLINAELDKRASK